jgi:transposase
MDRYLGLDVHAQNCTLAVMGPTGKHLRELVVETNGQALVDALRGIAGQKHLCMEEGAQSAWLYEILEPHVDELVVVQREARHPGSKSDSIDAWQLAEQIRIGQIARRVFKAPGQYTALREAEHAYRATRTQVVRAKNQLKALYRARGIAPEDALYAPTQRESWLRKLPRPYRTRAEMLATQLDALVASHTEAEAWLLREAERVPVTKRLQTVPGIGPIRAAQIVAIVITPERFRTKRQFWSYCGFGIVTRSSADWVREGNQWVRKQMPLPRGLTRQRNGVLKDVFKGAANIVIQCMPKHPLHTDYQRLLRAGTKPNLARLTLARRLAAATLAVWKSEEDYNPAKHQSDRAA